MEYWKIDLPWNVADYNRSRRLGKQITLEALLIPLKQDQTNILSVPTRGRMSFTITHTNMLQMSPHMVLYQLLLVYTESLHVGLINALYLTTCTAVISQVNTKHALYN